MVGSEQMFGGDKSGEEPQEKHTYYVAVFNSTHIKRATSFIVRTWQGKVNAPIIVRDEKRGDKGILTHIIK